MTIESFDYGTPELNQGAADIAKRAAEMAGDAVRDMYIWRANQDDADIAGRLEEAELCDKAAEACRNAANILLAMLSPESGPQTKG